MKDRWFARTYGVIAGGVVPALSYGLWLTRDVMTMSAAFTLPPVVGAMVQGSGMLEEQSAKVASQLAVPMLAQVTGGWGGGGRAEGTHPTLPPPPHHFDSACLPTPRPPPPHPTTPQFLCTPLHLLGLDLYNRNHASWAERGAFLGAQVPTTIVARSIRMLPGGWGRGWGGSGLHCTCASLPRSARTLPLASLSSPAHSFPLSARTLPPSCFSFFSPHSFPLSARTLPPSCSRRFPGLPRLARASPPRASPPRPASAWGFGGLINTEGRRLAHEAARGDGRK